MIKRTALLLCLCTCVFCIADASALVVNFRDYNLGPSNPLMVSGVTITARSTDTRYYKGHPRIVKGVGLGIDAIGKPGYVEWTSYYGESDYPVATVEESGIKLEVNGVINSVTIKPYCTLPPGEQFVFEVVDGGFDNTADVDVNVPSYTFQIESGLGYPVNTAWFSITDSWGMAYNSAWIYKREKNLYGISVQYGFTITSIDYTPAGSQDVVTIDAVNYYDGTDRLVISAISSDQPNVKLTAEGFGPLAWKPTLGVYKNTFTVYEKPDQVRVTSTGGGEATVFLPKDEVNIQSVSYSPSNQTLIVTATSSDQPDVKLTVDGFGPLAWKSWLGLYKNTFFGVSSHPYSITVRSSGGGSDEQQVP